MNDHDSDHDSGELPAPSGGDYSWDTCEIGYFIDQYQPGFETVGGGDLWPVGWRISRIDRVTTARCWKVIFSVLPCGDLVNDGKTVERILRRLGWLRR